MQTLYSVLCAIEIGKTHIKMMYANYKNTDSLHF